MNKLLKLLLEGENLSTGQMSEILGMDTAEVETELDKLKAQNILLGWRPVLHPNVGAAEMYARDGENSIYLADDIKESVRRIRDVLDSPETLQSMRGATLDSLDAFDPSRYGNRILEAAGIL